MKLRNPLIISALLHLCFFAATLLLSAGSLGGNSSGTRHNDKILNEKVLFVRLTEDISKSGNAQYVVEIGIPKPKKSLQVKTKKKPAIVGIDSYRDIQKKVVSVDPIRKQSFLSHGIETDIASENNNDLNTQEEAANNILTSYESGGDEVIDVSSVPEIAVNVSYSPFSSESRGTSGGNKGRGVLPPGIIEIIRNSIERAKTYPLLARKRGTEGTVHMSFRISPQGEPQDFKILKSSGSRILDKATLDIVKRAAPFPYVDSSIEVPVVFRLK
jgi:TonB family protein